jgi:hypothetical protein
MSVGKFTSLEEVRRNPRLLGRFIKQRLLAGDGVGDASEFESTLASMVKNSEPAAQTSSPASDEDCSETQTRRDTSPNASGKRGRASRE